MISIDEKDIVKISEEVLEDFKHVMNYKNPAKNCNYGSYNINEGKIGSLRYFIDKAIRRRMQ